MWIAIPLAALAAFIAGIAFSKVILSEASEVKDHVTAEVAALRAELRAGVGSVARKL